MDEDMEMLPPLLRVPPEILLHVLDFLIVPAPSELRLHDEPESLMLQNQQCPLKQLSRTCKILRSIVLPTLFQHVVWRPEIKSLSAFTLNPISLLQFLERTLGRPDAVDSFTFIVDFQDMHADERGVTPHIRSVDLEWLWDQIFSVVDPLRFTMIAPPNTMASFLSCMLFLEDSWSFGIPYHILSMSRETRKTEASKKVETASDDSSSSPSLTEKLANMRMKTASGTSTSNREPFGPGALQWKRTSVAKPTPCLLLHARPWTSLLLNEGSSLKVYRTYEFFLRRPPSVLGALLGCEEYPNDEPLIPATVSDLSYVAVFPLSSHVETLFSHLPRLDRLFVQLTPGPGNEVLQDSGMTRHVDPADLWLERNSAYGSVMKRLTGRLGPPGQPQPQHQQQQQQMAAAMADFDGDDEAATRENWARLRVFESGDAADEEAWDELVDWIARSPDKSWRVVRGGALVRCLDGEGGNGVEGVAAAAAETGGDMAATTLPPVPDPTGPNSL